MNKLGPFFLSLAGCMGLFGVGELSGVGLLAPNHLIALALGILLTTWFLLKGFLFRHNNSRWYVVIAVCVCFGALCAYLAGLNTTGTYRDTAAILLSLTLGVCGGATFRYFGEEGFWRATLFLSLLNVVILPVAWGLGEFPGINTWYGDRFLGVSRNPNQTALFGMVGLFAAVQMRCFVNMSRAGWGRLLVWIGGIGNLCVGIATRSSAFRLAVIVAICSFFATRFLQKRSSAALRGLSGMFFIIACCGVLTMHSGSTLFRAADEDGNIVRDEGQFEYRFLLWKESASLIAQFPFFGRGGGAAGGGFDINLEYEAMEAHNTIVDLAIATGLIGVAIFVWYIIRNTIHLWRGGLAFEIALMALLLTFAMFHNLLRQPLLWLMLAAAACWPERSLPRRALAGNLIGTTSSHRRAKFKVRA